MYAGIMFEKPLNVYAGGARIFYRAQIKPQQIGSLIENIYISNENSQQKHPPGVYVSFTLIEADILSKKLRL